MEKKEYQGGKLNKERGDKIHGNNSNAIAKLFKMKIEIVNLVIKVIEFGKKKWEIDTCYLRH